MKKIISISIIQIKETMVVYPPDILLLAPVTIILINPFLFLYNMLLYLPL